MEAQAGIKIAGRNINNLRYADDTTLMAQSEEELKSLLMKVKEESYMWNTKKKKNTSEYNRTETDSQIEASLPRRRGTGRLAK